MDSEMKLHNSKKDNTMTKKKKGLRRKATSTNHYIENEIFSKSNMKTLPNPNLYIFYKNFTRVSDKIQGRRGRDRIVVGFITTYAISAYHH
jgi:hypothetical protein